MSGGSSLVGARLHLNWEVDGSNIYGGMYSQDNINHTLDQTLS